MARREVHIDYHLFLILFSKALGAMVILFVIVPKLTGDVKHKLAQIEQLENLKIEVQQVDSLLEIVKKSVPEAVYKPMSEKIKKLQSSVSTLELKVKDLQNSLAKCDNQHSTLQKNINELNKQLEVLNNQVKNNDKSVSTIVTERDQLQNQVEVLKKQMIDCDQLRASLENKNTIESQLSTLQKESAAQLLTLKNQEDQIKQQQVELKKQENEIKQKDATIKQQQQQIADCQPVERTGVNIKDRNVVFVVDQSGSMDDAPETDKLDQTKAGLKMLIANMDDTYKVDIVIFPKSIDEEYGAKYGKLTAVNENVKYDIYNYIQTTFKAYGCTPTRDALKYVLSSPAYSGAGTIILLSDGAPTKRLNRMDCEDEVPSDVEDFIKQTNGGKRVINCIGVGAEFRNRTSTNKAVQFMKNVAKQNNGFYIGF